MRQYMGKDRDFSRLILLRLFGIAVACLRVVGCLPGTCCCIQKVPGSCSVAHRPAIVALATGFFQQTYFAYAYVMAQGFAHVVDGKGSQARAGEGFHLYARFTCKPGAAIDDNLAGVIDAYLDTDFFQGQRMAEGYQFAGFFGSHDACEDGRLKNSSFGGVDLLPVEKLQHLRRHDYGGPGFGGTYTHRFVSYIDHAGLPRLIKMRKFTHDMNTYMAGNECLAW